MFYIHLHPKTTIDSVHETMREARKLTNAALFRNLTNLKPIMHNPTHWSGKFHMVKRILQIRDELIEVRNEPDGNLEIDTSARLESKVQRFQKILAELYVVTKSLETGSQSLAECRDYVEFLVETVSEQRDDAYSSLYQ